MPNRVPASAGTRYFRGRRHLPLLGHRHWDKHAEIDDGCAARAPHPPCAHPIHPSRPTHRSRTLSPPSTAHVPPFTPRLHSALLLLCAQELYNLPVHIKAKTWAVAHVGGAPPTPICRPTSPDAVQDPVQDPVQDHLEDPVQDPVLNIAVQKIPCNIPGNQPPPPLLATASTPSVATAVRRRRPLPPPLSPVAPPPPIAAPSSPSHSPHACFCCCNFYPMHWSL